MGLIIEAKVKFFVEILEYTIFYMGLVRAEVNRR